MTTNRQSAIGRRPHPADSLPSREDAMSKPEPAVKPAATSAPKAPPASAADQEKLTATLNTRVKPSTKERLEEAVLKRKWETRDNSVSIAALTDLALTQFLDRENY